jgi:hypothetical protein
MKTVGAIAIVASLVIAASPAVAGKKKGKKKSKAVATEQVEAPRRLCETAGFGMVVASPTGDRGPSMQESQAQDADAVARAESFALGAGRDTSMPSSEDAIRLEVQPLTEAEVGEVVRGRGGDLEYCWSRVPAAQRDGLTLSLRFTIEPRGTVSKVELVGDAPAKLSVCVKAAAKRWTFPVADTTSVVDYPITLNQR